MTYPSLSPPFSIYICESNKWRKGKEGAKAKERKPFLAQRHCVGEVSDIFFFFLFVVGLHFSIGEILKRA